MQLGFLDRTPRGRMATERAFEYFRFRGASAASNRRCFNCYEDCLSRAGSNLGDREAKLRRRHRSARCGAVCASCARRPIYETEPQDVRDQPWFLNLVVEVETELFPVQLLHRTSKIEAQLGRRRLAPKGPRTIDIDILLYGNAVDANAGARDPASALARAPLRAGAAGGTGAAICATR